MQGRGRRPAAPQERLRDVRRTLALRGVPGPSAGPSRGPGGDDTGSGRPFGSGGPFADEFFPPLRSSGSTRRDPAAPSSPLDDFGYLPAAHGSTAVLPGGSGSAFRFHEVARDAERSPWRGRRFAFAAAGAVSLAAIALGGTLPLDSGPDPLLRAEGSGNSVIPLDAETRAGDPPRRSAAAAAPSRWAAAAWPSTGRLPMCRRPAGTGPRPCSPPRRQPSPRG
ncbi:hypothetical protein Smic_54800 [Streptomyces microflavus]|uniref:Uncharacterized protein n=1 Tax=Streptomyces microflavus TaxID=1919 RepID=A0A7J0CYG1_STRMI|nr:hypothetical protein Smic_54800 [Streptomyces microflavus]